MIKQKEGKSIQPKKGRTALSRFDGLVTRRLSKGCDGMCPANCNFLLRARARPTLPGQPGSQDQPLEHSERRTKGALSLESGMRAATAQLDHRRRRFSRGLSSLPEGRSGCGTELRGIGPG